MHHCPQVLARTVLILYEGSAVMQHARFRAKPPCPQQGGFSLKKAQRRAVAVVYQDDRHNKQGAGEARLTMTLLNTDGASKLSPLHPKVTARDELIVHGTRDHANTLFF